MPDFIPPQGAEQVPEEHLQALHEANERFSAARHQREEAIDSSSPEPTERDKAQKEMLDAEKIVEEVTEKIERDLHPAP